MFKPVNPKQSFPEMEKEILSFWEAENIFQQSIEQRKDQKKVIFFDGPPFANGLPHYGHILISIMKDAVARYWTMKGNYVPRTAGWDCHGLPVEYEIEKELNLAGKKDIEKLGVAEFNRRCRESVFKYTKEWEILMKRIGRWVDFENGYATLDNNYMESIWWVFKQIWDKNMVYEGHKAMQICPRCETPLSNFEVSQGYKDVTDLSVTVMFELAKEPRTYLLAWTTTPWSIISVTGLAVGKKITYVKVKTSRGNFILAKSRLETTFKDSGLEYEILEEMKGSQVAGLRYSHVFDYYNETQEVKLSKNVYHTVVTDYVTDTDGTGIVTINGAFGEDDLTAAKEHNLPVFVNVKMDGTYTDEVTDFAGKFVKGQDQNIAQYLEKRERLFKKENYRHSYPHCWRCDTPLLNYATQSWFVKVTEMKPNLMKNNEQINWQPEHIQGGRFGKWLEGARDWAISRNRFWGCPLPIWVNDNGDKICVGSVEELKQLTEGSLPLRDGALDLHKPYIDDITFMHPDYKDSNDSKYLMRRVPEVFDCWFESGAMPYAQLHYPFENKQDFEDNFPANFIIEAIDQTRGWFYTLHILATTLFDSPAFQNVIVSGHIAAADGEKLSKRKKNYPDPSELFENKGVDSMRFYLYSSPVVLGDGVRFSEQHVDEMLKRMTLTIWNTYSFFITYASIDGWDKSKAVENFKPQHPLDLWILSELNQLIENVTMEMDSYNLMRATRPMIDFIDNLSNWYIRRSRRRFWKSENDGDKNEAYQTLYSVLVQFSKLIAPFMPFLAEEMYKNLTQEKSVHLADWPKAHAEFIVPRLNHQTFAVRTIVALGHAVRDTAGIKVRQPLQKVQVALPANIKAADILSQKDVICEELNVKDFELLENIEGLVRRTLKPNAKVLGPKFGKYVQEIIQKAKLGKFEILPNNEVKIGEYILEEGQYEMGFEGEAGANVQSKDGISVILDVAITELLVEEGYARELVRAIQDLRKDADYQVNDRIEVLIEAEKVIADIVTRQADYIARETLALEIIQGGDLEWDKEKILEIDYNKIKVAVRKSQKK